MLKACIFTRKPNASGKQHYTCCQKKKNIYTIPVYFQAENIRSLCQAVPKNLGLVDTDVHCESINICTMYLLLLNKCAEYHQMLNGKIEFDDERVEGFSEI